MKGWPVTRDQETAREHHLIIMRIVSTALISFRWSQTISTAFHNEIITSEPRVLIALVTWCGWASSFRSWERIVVAPAWARWFPLPLPPSDFVEKGRPRVGWVRPHRAGCAGSWGVRRVDARGGRTGAPALHRASFDDRTLSQDLFEPRASYASIARKDR
jgi:hypothetical protein